MTVVKPYTDSGSKKTQVNDMFSRVAHSYDMLNHLLSAGVDKSWRKDVVKIATSYNPQKILDVATGTGDLAIMLHNALPHANIIGMDLCKEMLDVAKTKCQSNNVTFLQGDAEHIDIESQSIDLVTAAFGVRNFEQLDKGLSEMLRVLKKDGRVIILEFSMPKNRIINTFYSFYFKKVLPLIGGIVSGDRGAYDYLPRSVEGSIYGDQFTKLMSQVGFENITMKTKYFGVATIYIGESKK